MSGRTVTITCDNCGVLFERSISNVNQAKKRGHRNICNRSCSSKLGNKLRQRHTGVLPPQLNPSNKLDNFSPFRKHLSMAKARSKVRNQPFSLTLEDLLFQWDKQQGVCPYTGWKLDNPVSMSDWSNKNLSTRRASLDRINSSTGYTKDNIQFVSIMANYAKNSFKSSDLIEFCKAVSENTDRGGFEPPTLTGGFTSNEVPRPNRTLSI